MHTKYRKYIIRSIFLYGFLYPFYSEAAETNYGVAINYTSYENVSLIKESPGKELSTSAQGVLSYSEDTSDHVSRLGIDLEFINYKENQLDDDVNGALTMQSTIVIDPASFEWYFSDVFSRVTIDPLEAASSSNLINANAFLTGPNFYFRINKSSNLNLSIRAENYLYEESEFENSDNNRLTSTASYVHLLNPTSSLSLNFEYSIVEYDNKTLNSNYDRSDNFLEFNYQRSIYSFGVEAGVTNIIYDDSSIDDVNQSRYQLSIQAERTRTSNIELEFFQRVIDTSTSLLDQLNSEDISLSTSSSNSDLYIDTGGNVIYRENSPSFSFSLQLGYYETRYNTQKDLNVDVERGVLQYESRINRTSGIVFETRIAQSSYSDLVPSRVDDDVFYSLAYRLALKRTINLRFSFEDEKRDSTINEQLYDDFRIRISLEYVSI